MGTSLQGWLRISLFNLLIVALIGVTLRYKLAFSLTFINQKHLLHGHSHFAFAGWITQVLMVLLIHYLSQYKGEIIYQKYRLLLYGNLITAYGMLISFPLQGYGPWSISFSTLSIINSYFFAMLYWKDLNSLPQNRISHYWYKAALFFNIISSIGAFALAYMMANKIIHQSWYLASIYYFLHFQYNGWFFFAGMGLLTAKLEKVIPLSKRLVIIFWVFFLACMPAYFLSTLWTSIPLLIYGLSIAAATAQFIGWIILIKLIAKNINIIKPFFAEKARPLLLLSGIALTIKLLLQLGSTHPALSQLAFGFRPIVIAYLHLALLGVISSFILGYIISINILPARRYFITGVWIFVCGIIINEVLLMLQGICGLYYIVIPFINEFLFATAILMFGGILTLLIRTVKATTLLVMLSVLQVFF